MAKYFVVFSCGHQGKVQLYGPMRERERRLAWLREHGLCEECYKASRAKAVAVLEWTDDRVSIALDRGYEIRNDLKARGYRFNGQTKRWERIVPEMEFTDEWKFLRSLNVVPAGSLDELVIEFLVKREPESA